jgi:hypothetical protein
MGLWYPMRLSEPQKMPGYGRKKKNSCLLQELKSDHHSTESYTKNTYLNSFGAAI